MKKQYLVILVVILALAGCYGSSNIYQSEKTKGINFKKYKTYAWLPTTDTSYTKLVSKKKVEKALVTEVIKQLTKRGMTLDTLHPDCLFTYTLVMNKTYQVGQQPPEIYNQQQYAPMYAGQAQVYYYIPYSGPTYYSGGLDVTTYRDGSLIIDMIDRQDNKIIWRTSAQGKQDEDNRLGVKTTIEEIIPQMFKKFPVK
jgi:Domain of unknown function (DUF4136)